MRKKIIILICFSISLIIPNGCSIKWTEAIQRGKVHENEFIGTADIEITNGLIIVPVILNGEIHRFLYDSGAPFSISETLQNELKYKIISRGHIVDSDNNRTKVNYVQVDTIFISEIPFIDQTAFVGNFESNPVINCLDIDGIIGSNLIRHCNWKIDYQNEKITLSNTPLPEIRNEGVVIPFHTDIQYNILIDLKISESVIKNMTVDYGSNGSISLPENVFHTLKEKEVIGKTYLEKGVVQSGIIGNPVHINREITYIDTIRSGELIIDNVEIKSGNSGLIGKKVLSRYIVTIDWNGRKLYLKRIDSAEINLETFGFHIGYSTDKNLYIQSVIENSAAFSAGIQPNMQVLKIDSLDFSKNSNFCDYMKYMNVVSDNITLELYTTDKTTKKVYLEKQKLDYIEY